MSDYPKMEPDYIVMSNEELGDECRRLHQKNTDLRQILALQQSALEELTNIVRELKEATK